MRGIAKKALGSAALLLVAVLVCAALDWTAVLWVVAISVTLLFCIPVFKLYEIFGSSPAVRKIEFIRHEYSTRFEKGTGGMPQVHTYTTIRQEHDLIFTLADTDGENGKRTEIVLPSKYENFFNVGDILLCHPLLPYPANLSHPTSCLCMVCGTSQSAEERLCHHCGALLFNGTTVNATEEDDTEAG